MTGGFAPTHVVPSGGLAAYERADPAAVVVARLDPDLEVTVVERLGDWARIVCSNGWGAWVDARPLVARGPRPAASTPKVGEVPLSPALGGAALVAIGVFLPWLRGAGIESGNAFDLPASMLWSSPRSTSNGPVDLWVLLAVAVVAGVIGCIQDQEKVRRAAGLGAVAVAALFTVWLFRLTTDSQVSVGMLDIINVGAPAVAAGGALLAFGKAAR